MELYELIPLLQNEIAFGHALYGSYHNSHEHHSVLLEEVEEWWDAVKRNTDGKEMYELIQVAAVALRYVMERGDIKELQCKQVDRHLRGLKNV